MLRKPLLPLLSFFILSALLTAAGAFAQSMQPAQFPGRAVKESKAVARKIHPGYQIGKQPAEYRLAALSESDSRHKSGRNLPQVGVRRVVPSEALSGATVVTLADGRRLWRATISSPGASGLRVHFRDFAANGGELWVYSNAAGADPADAEGPYTGAGPFGDGDFWTVVVNADAVTIEFAAPAGSDPLPPFSIESVLHLWDAPLAPSGGETAPMAAPLPADRTREQEPPPLAAAGVQAATTCHLDVSCYPELANYASAVAQYSFAGDDGGAYVCTGTMINTRSQSFKPYLLTAHHCIGSVSEARSMSVRFNYQTSTCNGTPPDKYSMPFVNVATYLGGAPIAEGDYALVQLRLDPPVGTYFLGWDQSTSALAMQAAATGIHHPDGSWKRVSFGNRTPDADVDIGEELAPGSLYYSIRWIQGVTEGGSSGSALMNGQGQVVGTLTYGPDVPIGQTACDVDRSAGYGRFSNAYNGLRAFLEDTESPDLSVTPTTLSFSATGGRFTSAAHQSISIHTSSATVQPFAAVASADWILLSASTGEVSASTPASLDVTIDLTKLYQNTNWYFNETIRIISGSMAPISVTVKVAITESAAQVRMTTDPGPVVQQAPDADGYSWFYRIVLTESGGFAATVKTLRIGGIDYSNKVVELFGSNQLPANGTLSAPMRARDLVLPYHLEIQADGTDSIGRTWRAGASVSFLRRPGSSIMTLDSVPWPIHQNPASTNCPWFQQLVLTENTGLDVTINRFIAGGQDLTSRIAELWGTTSLPENGTLIADLCWTGAPYDQTAQVGGLDSTGTPVTRKAEANFSGPAERPTTMSVPGGPVSLAAGSGYTSQLTATRSLQLGSGFADWNGRLLFANSSRGWMNVSPLAGLGPDTIRFTAPPGVAAGFYSATLQLTSTDAIPALINVPITLIVQPQSGAPVAAQLFPHLADGGEWQTEFLLTNESSTAVTGRLLFHLDGGQTWLPVTGLGSVPEISITVPAHGSVLYRTTGSATAPLITGWAELLAASPLTGQALFRRHAGDGKYYEGAIPLTAPSRGFTMPFDGTAFAGTPLYTGLAIANADSTQSGVVTCSAYEEHGRLLGANLQLASLGPSTHTSAVLQWSEPTKSVMGTSRGLLVCDSSTPIGVLGLRFFGAYALASLPVTAH